MAVVTFQVLEGVDKGKVFRELPTPVTIGREEGNVLRLNDERVSRYHAKVQQDNGDIILTDLDSTNGTRVNGAVVQIRRLRPGDRVNVGRSLLLFGSNEEIVARMAQQGPNARQAIGGPSGGAHAGQSSGTYQSRTFADAFDAEADFNLNLEGEVTITDDALFIGGHALPPLPQKMSPAQAARMAEILDFLHQGITRGTENIKTNEEGTQITLGFNEWQKVMAVQMLLARYLRAISDPDALSD